MTTWNPGDGGPDVLSSGGEGELRLTTVQAVARLLLCFGVGIALGAHVSAGRVAANESAGPSRLERAASCAAAWAPDGAPRGSCPQGGRPAGTSDLAGTWLRVGVQGVWRGVESREFMRFEPDGRFTWGMTGHLTSPYRAVRGQYVAADGTVTVSVHRTSPCTVCDTSTWRATLSGGNLLHLAYAPGSDRVCGRSATGVWSARRHAVGPPSSRSPAARGSTLTPTAVLVAATGR